MLKNNSSLKDQLIAFGLQNKKLLEQGKGLLALLDDPATARTVDKPLMLKMVLEKYLELIEDRLLREIPDPGSHSPASCQAEKMPAVDDFSDTMAPRSPCAKAKADAEKQKNANDSGSYLSAKHLIDDFRGTDPRYRPIARKSQRNEPATQKPKAPKNNHRIEVIRSNRPAATPQPRQVVRVETPAPQTSAAKPAPATSMHEFAHIGNDTHPGKRRATTRYACHMPLSYRGEPGERTMVKAYSKDVCALGLFILSNRPQKTGDQLAIEVEMPDHKKAVLHAVVQWTKWVPQNLRSVDMPGFGVKITSAPEAWYSYFMNEPSPTHAHL